MTTALYRISSSEVLKISIKNQTFSDRDPAIFGVLTDPTTPDGVNVRDVSGPEPGPRRVLGFAKIAEPGGNNVRNATQPEIDTFAAAETADNDVLDADQAANLGDTHPQFRKLVKSILKGIVRENNLMAAQWNAFRAEVAAATNLGNLQSRVADNTTDVPIRTNQQAFNAIRSDVSSAD